MAATKTKIVAKRPSTATKERTSATRKEVENLQTKVNQLENSAWCWLCNEHKSRDNFYASTDPRSQSGLTPICKLCAEKIAYRVSETGLRQKPDIVSVKKALYYLNKPFKTVVWQKCVDEVNHNPKSPMSDYYKAYMRSIANPTYAGLTFEDSDGYNKPVELPSIFKGDLSTEMQEQFQQNKSDTLRLLGYDPFENEAPSEQPFLYSNLIGYLDTSEDGNKDQMKISSIIEIVKDFNHIEKINKTISSILNSPKDMIANVQNISKLETAKKDMTTSILNLAKDSGISLKHSVNASKGEDTWTGKVKKLKEMNLREQEVNVYDAEYSAGLMQVAEISDAAILKQIRLDENDSADMIAQARELVTKYRIEAESSTEKARLLLRENSDLKELLAKNGINLEEN